MSESVGRGEENDLSAGQILALHAEHRNGLHVTPRAECIQCTFDGLVRLEGDASQPLGEPEPT